MKSSSREQKDARASPSLTKTRVHSFKNTQAQSFLQSQNEPTSRDEKTLMSKLRLDGLEKLRYQNTSQTSQINKIQSFERPFKSSRFFEIVNLKNQNKKLKQQITNAQEEIEQLDEFKVALHSKSPSKQTVFTNLEHNIKSKRSNLSYSTKVVDQNPPDDAEEESRNNPRQINILKSQIIKQKRYINRLTVLLQQTRLFFEDLKSYLKYFQQVLLRSDISQKLYSIPTEMDVFYEQLNESDQKKAQMDDSFEMKNRASSPTKLKAIGNPKELQEIVDQKQQYVSLKTLLKTFKSNEEKDHFLNNFNSVYQKVIEFDRKNQEFSSLFDVAKGKPSMRSLNDKQTTINRRKTQLGFMSLNILFKVQIFDSDMKQGEWYLRYNHPIRRLLQKFGKFFPVKSIFQSFPMKDRESMENMITALEGMAYQIQGNFRKIDSFYLFKTNPFYFNEQGASTKGENKQDLSIPFKLVEEKWLLDVLNTFLSTQTTLPLLSLNKLSETSQSLSQLLSQLLLQLQPKPKQNELWDSYHFRYELINSIENLLTLGIMVGDSNTTTNKIQIILDQQETMNEDSNKPFSSLNLNQSNGNYSFFYDKAFQSNNEFGQKYTLLETLVEDLNACVTNENPGLSILMRKIQTLLRSLKYSYELQFNLCKLREAEVSFVKSKLILFEVQQNIYTIYSQGDLQNLKSYVNEASLQVNNFFKFIDDKLTNLNQNFNQFIDTEKTNDPKLKRTITNQFKQTLRDISEWVKKYQSIQRKDNTINILQIKEQFEQKVNFLFVKFKSTEQHMKNWMEDVTRDQKK